MHIGAYNRFASKYEVKIEDNVLFAAYVHITDHSHKFRDIDAPVMKQGTYEKGPGAGRGRVVDWLSGQYTVWCHNRETLCGGGWCCCH